MQNLQQMTSSASKGAVARVQMIRATEFRQRSKSGQFMTTSTFSRAFHSVWLWLKLINGRLVGLHLADCRQMKI